MKFDLLNKFENDDRYLRPVTPPTQPIQPIQLPFNPPDLSSSSSLSSQSSAPSVNSNLDDDKNYEISMALIRSIVSDLNDCSFLINQTFGNNLKKREEALSLIQSISELINELLKLPVKPKSNGIRIERNSHPTLLDNCNNDSIVLIKHDERAKVVNMLTRNRNALMTNTDAIHKNERLNLLIDTTETTELLLDLPIKKFIKDNFSENEENSSSSGIDLDDNLTQSDDMNEPEASTTIQSNKSMESNATAREDKSDESDAKPVLPDNSINKAEKTLNLDKLNDSEANTTLGQLIDLTDEMDDIEVTLDDIKKEEPMDFSNKTLNLSSSTDKSSASTVRQTSGPAKKRPKIMEIDSDVEAIDEVVEPSRFKFEFKNMGKFLSNKNLKKRSVSFPCYNNIWFLRVYLSSNTEKRTNQNNNYVKIGLVREKSMNGEAEPDKLQVNFDLKLINTLKNGQDRVEIFKKAIFEGERDTCWCRDKFVNYHDM